MTTVTNEASTEKAAPRTLRLCEVVNVENADHGNNLGANGSSSLFRQIPPILLSVSAGEGLKVINVHLPNLDGTRFLNGTFGIHGPVWRAAYSLVHSRISQ